MSARKSRSRHSSSLGGVYLSMPKTSLRAAAEAGGSDVSDHPQRKELLTRMQASGYGALYTFLGTLTIMELLALLGTAALYVKNKKDLVGADSSDKTEADEKFKKTALGVQVIAIITALIGAAGGAAGGAMIGPVG